MDMPSLSQIANEIVARIVKQGGRALAVEADLTSEDQIKTAFEELDDCFPPLTALVNNAGIVGWSTGSKSKRSS